MEIVIDDVRIDSFDASKERHISPRDGPDEVSGVVIDERAAARDYARRLLWGVVILTVLVWLFLFAMSFALTPMDRERMGGYLVVLAIAFPIAMAWIHNLKTARFVAEEPRRFMDLPAPGTQIRIDSQGLRVGKAAVAWKDLSPTRLEMTSMPAGRGPTRYFLKRILVRGPGLDCAIDASLIENGAEMIGAVYRRLCQAELNPNDEGGGLFG